MRQVCLPAFSCVVDQNALICGHPSFYQSSYSQLQPLSENHPVRAQTGPAEIQTTSVRDADERERWQASTTHTRQVQRPRCGSENALYAPRQSSLLTSDLLT
jgi:DNA-directed RNA polymerase subunit M/transcription elongation factor TFIIS